MEEIKTWPTKPPLEGEFITGNIYFIGTFGTYQTNIYVLKRKSMIPVTIYGTPILNTLLKDMKNGDTVKITCIGEIFLKHITVTAKNWIVEKIHK